MQQGTKILTIEIDKSNNRNLHAFQYALKRLSSFRLQPNQRLSNGRILCDVFVYILNVFSCIMFVIFEANTFRKYTNSIFILIAAVVGSFSFIILTVKTTKILKLCEYAQKIVEDSKYFFLFIQHSEILNPLFPNQLVCI